MIKIVKDSNPKIREKSVEVPLPLSKEDAEFIEEMMKYLKLSQDPEYREKHPACREGVGLAAPQAGRNVRMLVISYANPTEEDPNRITEYELVNPRIIVNSIKKTYLQGGEGCLSVDEEHPGYVYRDFKIVVEAYDHLLGKKTHITARGYDAIVLQHEIDHLNGVLFYDHIDPKDPFKKIPGSVAV
jgi:peptide deformylase